MITQYAFNVLDYDLEKALRQMHGEILNVDFLEYNASSYAENINFT